MARRDARVLVLSLILIPFPFLEPEFPKKENGIVQSKTRTFRCGLCELVNCFNSISQVIPPANVNVGGADSTQ